MENKNLIIILVLIFLIGGGLIFYYQSGFQLFKPELPEPEDVIEEEKPDVVLEDVVLEKERFSILVPGGWKELQSPEGVLAMVIKDGEEITDPEVKAIQFRSYLAISLGDMTGKTKEEYLDYTRDVIIGILGEESFFVKEEELQIKGREANIMEIDTTQQGAELKVWVILVFGDEQDVWGMSFNTTQTKWSEYQSAFSKMAQSFELK
ncbi:MAG: hypothetical protein ABH831_02040 [Candidatus Nealsonbacteria bacterium]